MNVSVADIALRLTNSRAQCVSIHANGLIRVTHRWGTMDFPTEADFEGWVRTGQLPNGARAKFADFDPAKPN